MAKRIRMLVVWSAAACCLGVVGCGAANPATRSSSPLVLGVHQDLTWGQGATERAAAIGVAKRIGARVSRNSLLWDKVETRQGSFDWSATDAVVRELDAAGIEPMFVIYGSPPWASGVDPDLPDAQLYVPTAKARFATWLAGYEAFVRAAVVRYRGSVHRWEIWNEENLHYFWKPTPDVDAYTRLYSALRDVITDVDPTAQVAVGGLSSYCCVGPGDVSGRDFLARLAGHAPIDNVAVHVYSDDATPPGRHLQGVNNFDDIAAWRARMNASGLRAASLWVTEFGWASKGIGEQRQAADLRDALELLRDRFTYVTLAIYFLDIDRPGTFSQGLFTAQLRPKPAAAVFARFAARVAGR